MIKEQEKDLLCRDIRACMTKGELREENRNPYPIWAKEIELYFTRDGVLCREGPPISNKRSCSPQLQVVTGYSYKTAPRRISRLTPIRPFSDQTNSPPVRG
jgi:hypothetical protein